MTGASSRACAFPLHRKSHSMPTPSSPPRRQPASERKTARQRWNTTKCRGELPEYAFVYKAASLGFLGDLYRVMAQRRSRGRRGTRDTKKCDPCSLRPQYTSAAFRGLIHPPERTSPTTCAGVGQHPGVRQSTAAKKEGEALFAELKNQIGLRRLRRLWLVREQFFLAAVAQNIRRLVRFLSQPIRPVLPVTT
jgi:hypothetical protein